MSSESTGLPSMMTASLSAVAAPLASAHSAAAAAALNAGAQAHAQAAAAAAALAAEKDKEVERLRSEVQSLAKNLESMIARREADKEKLAELERLRLQLLQVRTCAHWLLLGTLLVI